MKNDPIRTKVLSIRLIPNADRFLLKAMQVQEGHRSLGLITTDCDDVSYAALDEATKKADVSVAYARSMYAGSSNASTALAGEFIGILSGENPEDVKSGLAAAVSYIEMMPVFTVPIMMTVLFILPSAYQGPAVICRRWPVCRKERQWLI